jgi:methyl coenzyme M reductase subunit D
MLRKLEHAARLENLTVSQYIVQKLKETMSSSWPENYERLFGAIDDESFTVPDDLDFGNDTDRQKL